MKTAKNFFVSVILSILIVPTMGCKSNNSVKDNSGDNIHQEDEQDKNFNRTDTTYYPSDSTKSSTTTNK
jgi:hypothetical protein